MINEWTPIPNFYSFKYSVIVSALLGILFGVTTGSIDLVLEKTSFKKITIGATILIRSITYPIYLFAIVMLMRLVVYGLIFTPKDNDFFNFSESNVSSKYMILMLVIYTTVVSAVVAFINQMNRRFSPGMVIPLLMGNYRKPQEQERFFMFLDLKSSTVHAESLGHIKYSSLIRDCFMDINSVVYKYNGEIYQYVGDEVVISWPVIEGIRNMDCIKFFFSVSKKFESRSQYYNSNYGFDPIFKAGLHLGKVTVVEVGEIKREIAYHGDTLNTAARMQGLCNTYNSLFLISGEVVDVMDFDNSGIETKKIGDILLRGKSKSVDIFDVHLNHQN